ncbi:MAG: hypothetical protein ACFE8N_02620 [Promethearchaeota archaeon]
MTEQKINDKPEIRIKKWLEQITQFQETVHFSREKKLERVDLNPQIREAAYFLSLEHASYEDLCWKLAEKILQKNVSLPKIEDIRKKAETISKLSKSYDELCWLIAEIDIMTTK